MEYSQVQSPDVALRDDSWQPGVLRRMPWTGLCCILGALLGIAASVAIVAASNDVPITDWQHPPTVYLSITYTITNILIVVALSQGVTTSWWRRAAGPKTELGDLHRYWSFGTSPFAAIVAGKKFNFIAFASILVAVTPMNGPLLQRSVSIKPQDKSAQLDLRVRAALTLEVPTLYSAGPTYDSSALVDTVYKPVTLDFYNSTEIIANQTGCAGDGICRGHLRAAGLSVNCSSSSNQFNLIYDYGAGNMCPLDYAANVFTTRFLYADVSTTPFLNNTAGSILLWAQYKYPSSSDFSILEQCEGCIQSQRTNCTGSVMYNTCYLIPATVQYPVLIDGNKSTISLDPASTIFDDVVAEINPPPNSSVYHSQLPIAGLAVALQDRYGGNASLGCGRVGVHLAAEGPTGAQFANLSVLDAMDQDQLDYCNITFTDPTAEMLENARRLMFRTSLAFTNSSDTQIFTGMQVRTTNVYDMNWAYLSGAVILTVAAILVTLLTFNGFWTLGRDVSLSPLEIAKAFNAPLLTDERSNAKASEMLNSTGTKRVRYQQVVIEAVMPTDLDPEDGESGEASKMSVAIVPRLEIVEL